MKVLDHHLVDFKMKTDKAPVFLSKEMGWAVRKSVSPFAADASLVMRISVLMANAYFDAIAITRIHDVPLLTKKDILTLFLLIIIPY